MMDIKKLKLSTLSENTAKTINFLGEWGWSMHIQAGELSLLFDTGYSVSSSHNGAILGVDFRGIDKILLSHGHCDHTGGLRDVLHRTGKRVVEIIGHPEIWGPKFSKHEEEYVYSGIPCTKIEIEGRLGGKFAESRQPVWVSDDIVWSGEIPMTNDFETGNPTSFLLTSPDAPTDKESSFKPDPIIDDAAVFIKTDEGLVIVLGCAHRGIVNTIHHAQKLTGVEKVHTVVGGTHLCVADEDRLGATIAELKRINIKRLGVSHCTGFHAMKRLSEELGDEIFFVNNAGNVL